MNIAEFLLLYFFTASSTIQKLIEINYSNLQDPKPPDDIESDQPKEAEASSEIIRHSPTKRMDRQSRPSSPLATRSQANGQRDREKDYDSEDSREDMPSRDTVLNVGKCFDCA